MKDNIKITSAILNILNATELLRDIDIKTANILLSVSQLLINKFNISECSIKEIKKISESISK